MTSRSRRKSSSGWARVRAAKCSATTERVAVTTHTPRDLARELGYSDEARPGLVVRAYLRKRYPEHPKHQPGELDEEQADDVRAHVPRRN